MVRFNLLFLLASISLNANAFTPKVVCLDFNTKFIGWLTALECKERGGTAPDLKKIEGQTTQSDKSNKASDAVQTQP